MGQVTREEFDAFCREGRLTGTEQNRRAGDLLKTYLERVGFTPIETPLGLSWRQLFVFFVLVVFLGVFDVPLKNPFFFVILFLALAPVFKLWQGMRSKTPLAIYGVRNDVLAATSPTGVETGTEAIRTQPRPTVILCAHYDTASLPFPFHGSLLRSAISLFFAIALVSFLAGLLSEFVHPGLKPMGLGLFFMAFILYAFFRNASPGADDNASGVFAVLECLRRFGHHPEVNIVPMFFNFEEQGLIGSRAWARRNLGKKGQGIPGIKMDPKQTYVINFDCVGRGRRMFISGNKWLRERLLATAAAKKVRAARTWFYPSDHLAFQRSCKAVSFLRAGRFWMLDLGWVHSKRDVPDAIRLEYLAELAAIVEEFVMDLSASQKENLR